MENIIYQIYALLRRNTNMDTCIKLIEELDFSEVMGYTSSMSGLCAYPNILSDALNYEKYEIFELLLKKYHKADPSFLTKKLKLDNCSSITRYLYNAILVEDYDLIELILRYVVNIDELNVFDVEPDFRETYNHLPLEIKELLVMNGAREFIRMDLNVNMN